MIDAATKLVAIVGPTASGKTELALRLADEFGGEIICADSRTLYRGMDTGTAKPTMDEQNRVKHYLIDVADPSEVMSAAVFKDMAEGAIRQITERGCRPFLVGGSGLYLYSVVYDFAFPGGARSELRAELEAKPLSDLVARLEFEDPERAAEIDVKNARRVIRALETVGQPREREMRLAPNILLLGIRMSANDLNKRIERRTAGMLEMGLVSEVNDLISRYGTELEVLKSPGYAETVAYLRGDTNLKEAETLINLHTRQLVKRQLTWFARNNEIKWLEATSDDELEEQAKSLVARFLS